MVDKQNSLLDISKLTSRPLQSVLNCSKAVFNKKMNSGHFLNFKDTNTLLRAMGFACKYYFSSLENDPTEKLKAQLELLKKNSIEMMSNRAKSNNFSRCPVISIVGHVNHGKTTLIDSIMKTSTAKLEAGNITQNVQFFTLKNDMNKPFLTLIDTPGHSLFSSMRSTATMLSDARTAEKVTKLTDQLESLKLANKNKEEKIIPDDNGTSLPKLKILIKCDTFGSAKAMKEILDEFSSKKVNLSVVKLEAGLLTIKDAQLCHELRAKIFLLNSRLASDEVKHFLSEHEIKIGKYQIMYDLIDSLVNDLTGILPKEAIESIIGVGNIIKKFRYSEKNKVKNVAGIKLSKGKALMGNTLKVLDSASNSKYFTLKSMKMEKDSVELVDDDRPFGAMVNEDDFEFNEADTVQFIERKFVPGTLDWSPLS
ncbi:MAG: Translation initiation factor IF-2, mitochondrial [Paramarteilia canceri]